MTAQPTARQTLAREPVTKAEQTRRTRALIIETGIRCLASLGYAQTSMQLIAKEAGISRGPLHYHFADKNDLMGAIASALPNGASAELLKRLNAARGPGERLATLVDVAIDQHLGVHHFAAIELLVAARQDTALAAAIAPHFIAAETGLDHWFCGFMDQSGWDDEDLVAFRCVMVAALRGLALDHVLQADAAAHARALGMFRRLVLSAGPGGRVQEP
jgi:AcrR family transcriptional regulator